MSTLPARVPISAFASSSQNSRRPAKANQSSTHVSGHPPSLMKTNAFGVDAYSSRGTANTSIPHLREAINSLDSKMASLMSQRHELESHLEQAVRLQSPVLRLPSELLASIFVIGVLGMDDDDPVMVPTLMLVCRYWADVALTTPILWSTIAVSAHDSLEKARRRLSRSKSCPLDITINFGPRIETTSNVTEQVIHAMDLIRPALWRTKSFRLSVPNRPQAHAALLRCQEDAPLLESLSIRIFHSMQDDHYSSPPLPLFNGYTPRLRSCSFTSFNFGWDLKLVSRLRVLKLGGYFNGFTPSANTLLSILRQCPELEELALRNMSNVDSESSCFTPDVEFMPSAPSQLVQLPRLTKVSFYYAGIALARQIMSRITFPALESLEFCYLENVTPIIQLLYTQALIRLPLRYLRVESCLFNEMKFVNLLRRLPSLITLELVDVEDVSTSLMRGLSSPHPWVCPKLETLTLDGCTTFDWDSLRTFIESRLPAHSPAYSRHVINPSPSSSSTRSVVFRPSSISSASAAAAAYARNGAKAHMNPHHAAAAVFLGPHRLHSIDVTRCSQISKEMVQWLRMYVADVKCEPAKGVWGEPVMP